MEPALAPIAGDIAGAIYYQADEIGDAQLFCTALAEHARKGGVEFRFATEVTSLKMGSKKIEALFAGDAPLVADIYIVAACSYSAPLLRSVAMHLPVEPAKGYSLTFEQPRAERALRVPVVDDDLHAVVVPIGSAIRVAGTAEFSGFDLRLQPARIRNLEKLAKQILPHAALTAATGSAWCGLRAMCADGVPIIGRTAIENLFIDTGHGHLGWTMAAGSARMLADLIELRKPAIDPTPYAPQRFL
jgi:D-amino-acid dehydrogenase